jgi:hypothetical protein
LESPQSVGGLLRRCTREVLCTLRLPCIVIVTPTWRDAISTSRRDSSLALSSPPSLRRVLVPLVILLLAAVASSSASTLLFTSSSSGSVSPRHVVAVTLSSCLTRSADGVGEVWRRVSDKVWGGKQELLLCRIPTHSAYAVQAQHGHTQTFKTPLQRTVCFVSRWQSPLRFRRIH